MINDGVAGGADEAALASAFENFDLLSTQLDNIKGVGAAEEAKPPTEAARRGRRPRTSSASETRAFC